MHNVTRNMAAITKTLDKALASNNLEQVASTMQQFEKQFENLDLQTQVGRRGGGRQGAACGLRGSAANGSSALPQSAPTPRPGPPRPGGRSPGCPPSPPRWWTA
jgi:hypothetical protein